jgi:hypothetical protein
MVFELKNKVPRDGSSYINSEDVLTSTVFGNLRYFSNQDLLISFLNKAVDRDKCGPNISSGIYFEISFWEQFRTNLCNRYSEPDMYLISDAWEIIIECKYHSRLEEESVETEDGEINYSNQLIRYSKIIENSNKQKVMIFLTNDPIMPNNVLDRSRNEIEKKGVKLYWLSWDKLYLSMKDEERSENFSNYSRNEKILFNDILEFLQKRQLIAFYGIRIPEINSFDWHYKKQYCFHSLNFICKWRYRNGAK